MSSNKETLIVNAIDSDRGELRIAQIKDKQLIKIHEQNDSTIITKGNIYLAKISSDVPSLEAYFIDYGEQKHGFLPYKETIKNAETGEPHKYNINDEIMIQISKEERGNKGAALTGEITVPGTFLVLLPKNPGIRGISKNIDEATRNNIEEKLKQLAIPKDMGVIARTSAKNRSVEDLAADLKYLQCVWQEISKVANLATAPELIFQEHQGIFKLVKDCIKPEIDQIIVDHEPTLNVIENFVDAVYPALKEKILFHNSKVPVFTHYQVEDSIEAMYSREVELQSGGKLVIDKTEAMYTIDVNSAQATNAKNVEKTALQTNLEAVQKVAQIINLREINGIIAIDLIDMHEDEHKQQIISEIKKCVANDKSRVAVIEEISELGILQLSRQRSKPSIAETNLISCPTCNGRGLTRSPVSFAYSLLHIIEQHAIHGKSATLIVQAPLKTATYIFNEKYDTLQAIEQRQEVSIKIIPNPHLEIPKYLIKRIRREDLTDNSLEPTAANNDWDAMVKTNKKYKHVLTNNFIPQQSKNKTCLVKKILSIFSSYKPSKQKTKNKPKPAARKNNAQRRKPNNRRGPKKATK